MKGILVNDNGDLMVSGGHVTVGDNREQCARHLITAWTGEYKHAPMLGGNVRRMIAGGHDPFWAGRMKEQLKQCHVEVEHLRVTEGEVELRLRT